MAFAASVLAGAPLLAGWLISQRVLHPKPRVEDHDVGDFDMTVEDVSFASRDGTPLSGWFIPAGPAGPSPGVVLSHGWGRSRAELLPHADFLHRAGFAVLSFDYRHRGKSGGDAITMGLREQNDLLAAIDTLSARPEVDPGRVAVFGMSMGAVVAVLVAAGDERVRAIVAECPFSSHDVIMSRSLRHYFRLPSFPFAAAAKWMIERRLGETLDGARAIDSVRALTPRPLLIIADERDAVIGSQETERLFQAAGEPKRFWLVPGADHARGWQTAPAEYERRVLVFLREALGPAGIAAQEEQAAPHPTAE
jgi:fermentation-respiration switch protein FrsA (DUF1100 family)